MDAFQPFMQLTSVTIGAPAPGELASFYARLLGGEVSAEETAQGGQSEESAWAQVKTGTFTLNFEHEQQWSAPEWPAVRGRQIATQHLDIWVKDLAVAVDWALSCGARLAQAQPQADVRVMLDPTGHPFCLFL